MIKKMILFLILAFCVHRAWGMEAEEPFVEEFSLPKARIIPRPLRVGECGFIERVPELNDEDGDEDDCEYVGETTPPPMLASEDMFVVPKKPAGVGVVVMLPDEPTCRLLRLMSTDGLVFTKQDIDRALRTLSVDRTLRTEIVKQALGVLNLCDIGALPGLLMGAGFEIDGTVIFRDEFVVARALRQLLRHNLRQEDVKSITFGALATGVGKSVICNRADENALASTLYRIAVRLAAKKKAVLAWLQGYLEPINPGDGTDISSESAASSTILGSPSTSPSDKDGAGS